MKTNGDLSLKKKKKDKMAGVKKLKLGREVLLSISAKCLDQFWGFKNQTLRWVCEYDFFQSPPEVFS